MIAVFFVAVDLHINATKSINFYKWAFELTLISHRKKIYNKFKITISTICFLISLILSSFLFSLFIFLSFYLLLRFTLFPFYSFSFLFITILLLFLLKQLLCRINWKMIAFMFFFGRNSCMSMKHKKKM